MDLSNKTLGLLLVAAIVISISGTIISLDRLDGISTTGFVTSNESGSVILSVPSSLSIRLLNDTIDFGACTINTSQGYSQVDSALPQTSVDNDDCTLTSTFPNYLVIDNDGNVNANVTLRTSDNGTSFFSTSNSWVAYSAINGSEPGCTYNLASTYTNFTATGLLNSYNLCGNLSYVDTSDEINVSIRSYIDSNSLAGGTITLTLVASDNS